MNLNSVLLAAMLSVFILINLSSCNSLQLDNANRALTDLANERPEKIKQQEFSVFKDRFLDEYWSFSPGWASYVGYYKYDDQLSVPSDAQRAAKAAFLVRALQQLNDFDTDEMSAADSTDYALINNQLESDLWYQSVFKSWQWDPSRYNVANIFGLLLNTEYKPLDQRLLTISRRLETVPAYYQAAMQSIRHPTAAHTRLAIEQNQGALAVFEQMIPAQMEQSGLSSQARRLLNTRLAAASVAINAYIDWLLKLEKDFESGATVSRNFRIGAALYEQKFRFDIVSEYTAKQLYTKALAAKRSLHADMQRLTEQLWPKYFATQAMPSNSLAAIKQMIDHLSLRHIERENFVPEIRRQMPIIQAFMDQQQLLDSDPTRPLVVREAPEYQRGFAGASVDAPGPYDATANTYYNVTPLDKFTAEQAESYLREYNHWTLQILNIHEAIPGHYTQLMHANKSPSKIKSVFGNGAMIEGWANYSERMMLEAGYGDNEPELWLMYDKWALRVVVNTILDYSVQVKHMQRADALHMLMNEAFQERTEAEGKWRRATLSQVQLTSYFNGYSEILAFREELKVAMGDAFDLRAFHNKFLSYGSAPVSAIRKLMLQELAAATD